MRLPLFAALVLLAVLAPLAVPTASAQPLALPDGPVVAAFDGARLAPTVLSYRTRFDVMGQVVDLEQTRRIEEAEHGRERVWRITDEATVMGQQIADTFLVARDDLRPIARTIHQGPTRLVLTYGPDTVTTDRGRTGTRVAAYEGRLDPDGAVLDFGLGTLPLGEGFRAAMQTFNAQAGVVERLNLVVVGTDSVTVAAGTFAVHVVELRPADGTRPATAYVDRESGFVVRNTTPLPASLGGGLTTSELVAIEPVETER